MKLFGFAGFSISLFSSIDPDSAETGYEAAASRPLGADPEL
jgi:hypothetical protein